MPQIIDTKKRLTYNRKLYIFKENYSQLTPVYKVDLDHFIGINCISWSTENILTMHEIQGNYNIYTTSELTHQ